MGRNLKSSDGLILTCVCGLEPIDGWQQKSGEPCVFFIHCPECDLMATAHSEPKASIDWVLFRNNYQRISNLYAVM